MRKLQRIGAMFTVGILVAGLAAGSGPAIAQTVSMSVYTVTAGSSPSSTVNAVMFDGTYIWAAVQNPGQGVLQKLTTTGTLISTTAIGQAPLELAFDGTNVWATDYTSSDVAIVGENGSLIKIIPLPSADPEGICFDGQSIWVANNGNNTDTVTKIDAASMTVVASYPVGRSPDGVAFDGTNIWVTNSYGDSVWVLNRSGVQLTGYLTGTFPLSILFDGHNMWIGNGTGVNTAPVPGIGSLTKIDVAHHLNIGTYTIGHHVRGLAYDGSSIWAVNGNDATVSRVRAAAPVALLGTFPTGKYPRAAAFDGGKVWVANSGENTLTVFVLNQSSGLITGQAPTTVQYRAVATVAQPPAWMTNILLDND